MKSINQEVCGDSNIQVGGNVTINLTPTKIVERNYLPKEAQNEDQSEPIANIETEKLMHVGTEELLTERNRCKQKMWEMRRRLFYATPQSILFWGCYLLFVVSLWVILPHSVMLFWASTLLFAISTAIYFHVNNSASELILYYRTRIRRIGIILLDRQ